mmetsp:Transcript_4063/g.7847  ORF Transcript_4063/g.7847 Transcript_4063/m.7847 type:complete len:246 (+) Transcript_4063:1848-2585(+)
MFFVKVTIVIIGLVVLVSHTSLGSCSRRRIVHRSAVTFASDNIGCINHSVVSLFFLFVRSIHWHCTYLLVLFIFFLFLCLFFFFWLLFLFLLAFCGFRCGFLTREVSSTATNRASFGVGALQIFLVVAFANFHHFCKLLLAIEQVRNFLPEGGELIFANPLTNHTIDASQQLRDKAQQRGRFKSRQRRFVDAYSPVQQLVACQRQFAEKFGRSRGCRCTTLPSILATRLVRGQTKFFPVTSDVPQ